MNYAAEQLEHHTRKAERKRKRIVVELPEEAKIASVAYLYGDDLLRSYKLIAAEELKEGAVIVCDPETDE